LLRRDWFDIYIGIMIDSIGLLSLQLQDYIYAGREGFRLFFRSLGSAAPLNTDSRADAYSYLFEPMNPVPDVVGNARVCITFWLPA
jgi:hypothetical protein